eukprot:8245623-Alexandrium_andersonii.AAC.1
MAPVALGRADPRAPAGHCQYTWRRTQSAVPQGQRVGRGGGRPAARRAGGVGAPVSYTHLRAHETSAHL